jgi:hypothetical protein
VAILDLIYPPRDRTRAFENHTNGYLVSLAGPGTGKTFSLLKRTEFLIGHGVSQETICYLTFIKEISNAFIQDYIERLDRPRTIHPSHVSPHFTDLPVDYFGIKAIASDMTVNSTLQIQLIAITMRQIPY